MENDKKLDKKILNVFFFILLFIFIYLGFKIFFPFWEIIAFSILIAVVSHPIHKRIKEKIDSESIAALFSTTLIFMFVLIPAVFFTFILVKQLLEIIPIASKFVSETKDIDYYLQNLPYVGNLYIKVKGLMLAAGVDMDLSSLGKRYGGTVANFIIDKGQSIITNVGIAIIDIFFILMTVFFLLRDGKSYYAEFYQLIPMPDRDKEFLTDKSKSAIKAIFLGTILTAFVQGFLGFVAYLVAGISFSLFWGFATFITSFLPLGGAAIIWLPVTIYLFATKGAIWGVAMLIWGALIISGSDNVVRPIIIGGQTNINTLILVFAILGGLQVFGFIGIFVTPIIVVLINNLLLLYKEKYLNFNIFHDSNNLGEREENQF